MRLLAELLIMAALVLCGSVAAKAAEPVVTREIAAKAAARFRASDPFSEDARLCAAIVVRFVEKDPVMKVTITQKAYPAPSKLPKEIGPILVGAYVVGAVDSQLRGGSQASSIYAGGVQMLETYRRIQKQKPEIRVPEIEHLADLEKRGELKSYLATP